MLGHVEPVRSTKSPINLSVRAGIAAALGSRRRVIPVAPFAAVLLIGLSVAALYKTMSLFMR